MWFIVPKPNTRELDTKSETPGIPINPNILLSRLNAYQLLHLMVVL